MRPEEFAREYELPVERVQAALPQQRVRGQPARELGDVGPDMDRRFDFAITYDRDLAIGAARAMMGRLAAL